MNTPTGKEIVDFILANRKDKTFKCSVEQIVYKILKAIQNNCICYNITPEGKVNGVLIATRDDTNKILYITDNLAMTLSNLKIFARMAKHYYPDYKLAYHKHDTQRIETDKVYNKLLQ